MDYRVEFSTKSKKILKQLDRDIALRILQKFEEIKQNPFRFIEHYEGRYYKIRIGDYRALIDMDFTRKILFVRIFDKRGRVYK
jgi:mRNA-degrading endonuclease RelE of RelBE toxin-antitoxin system